MSKERFREGNGQALGLIKVQISGARARVKMFGTFWVVVYTSTVPMCANRSQELYSTQFWPT